MGSTALLRISAVLWVVWGLVHAFAGVMTMSLDTGPAVAGIADAVDPATLEIAFPAAVGGVVGQHGFNLFWFGLFTTISAVFVWRGSRTAVFGAAIVGGLADIGYLIFMDFGGFVHFVPGTVMTIICAAAIITGFLGIRR